MTVTGSEHWTWDIVARKTGTGKITLKVYGVVKVDDDTHVLLAKSKKLEIQVVDKPPPPFGNRVLDWLASNIWTILSTTGPFGLIIAYLVYRANKTSKSLDDRLKKLEDKLENLGSEKAS